MRTRVGNGRTPPLHLCPSSHTPLSHPSFTSLFHTATAVQVTAAIIYFHFSLSPVVSSGDLIEPHLWLDTFRRWRPSPPLPAACCILVPRRCTWSEHSLACMWTCMRTCTSEHRPRLERCVHAHVPCLWRRSRLERRLARALACEEATPLYCRLRLTLRVQPTPTATSGRRLQSIASTGTHAASHVGWEAMRADAAGHVAVHARHDSSHWRRLDVNRIGTIGGLAQLVLPHMNGGQPHLPTLASITRLAAALTISTTTLAAALDANVSAVAPYILIPDATVPLLVAPPPPPAAPPPPSPAWPPPLERPSASTGPWPIVVALGAAAMLALVLHGCCTGVGAAPKRLTHQKKPFASPPSAPHMSAGTPSAPAPRLRGTSPPASAQRQGGTAPPASPSPSDGASPLVASAHRLRGTTPQAILQATPQKAAMAVRVETPMSCMAYPSAEQFAAARARKVAAMAGRAGVNPSHRVLQQYSLTSPLSHPQKGGHHQQGVSIIEL